MKRPFPAYHGSDPYVFVSYAHKDAHHIYPEITRLRQQGFNIWYDEGIDPGTTWNDEVALAITQCHLFLYYLTPKSVTSEHCQQELNFAQTQERKVLAVFLEPTKLPPGLALSLGNKQAIIRNDHTTAVYQTKLFDSLTTLVPKSMGRDTPKFEPRVTAMELAQTDTMELRPTVIHSSDMESEYLGDGILDIVRTELADLVHISAPTSARSSGMSNGNAGSEHGLELSLGIDKQTDGFHFTVLLRFAGDLSSLWSEEFVDPTEDVFKLQYAMAARLTQGIRTSIHPDESVSLAFYASQLKTTNQTALSRYSEGIEAYQQQSRSAMESSIESFKEAIHLDGQFEEAYQHLIFTSLHLMHHHGTGAVAAEETESVIVACEQSGSELLFPRGEILRQHHPDRHSQREVAERACNKIVNDETDWGYFEYVQLAECLAMSGLFEGAVDFCEAYLAKSTNNILTFYTKTMLMHLYSCVGRFDKAIEMCLLLEQVQNEDMMLKEELSMLYSRTGQFKKADEQLAIINQADQQNFPHFYHYLWLGESDSAEIFFEWLVEKKDLPRFFHYLGLLHLGKFEGALDLLRDFVTRVSRPAYVRIHQHRLLPGSIVEEFERRPDFRAVLADRYGINESWNQELLALVNSLSSITGIEVEMGGVL
jgi:tetratricopeptide (TPR) repeat protein|tara:strand:- start:27367 stop:29319 length:1953 start_codon:yes stop_codon:yes gene_type:complete